MKRLLILVLFVMPLVVSAQDPQSTQLIASADGLVSIHVPSTWYQTSTDTDTGQVLVAAPTPARAAEWQAPGGLLVHLYNDTAPDADANTLFGKTVKDHQLNALTFESVETTLLGYPAMQFSAADETLRSEITIFNLPGTDQWVRLVATALIDEWNADDATALRESLVILPQVAQPPRGWEATIRAPQNWTVSEFSSFTRWNAPEDSPFAGMEVWFQAGLRSDLVGQGDIRFVLQTMGVIYSTEVDVDAQMPTVLGGLPAVQFPFTSATHSGYALTVEGDTQFGTANLVARTRVGGWTVAHTQLLNAMVGSVSIQPPSVENAPIGLSQGYRAPAFAGSYADGSSFNSADFEDQLVFVHFWFVDCPFCREEWPHLNAVYEEYRDQGMVLLAVNAIDPLGYIEGYMQSENFDFPVVLDDGSLHNQFSVLAFPSTFVIGPDGIIVTAARGALSERTMRHLAEEYLVD